MSLNEMLKNNIDQVITVFMNRISCLYNLEYNEIKAIWNESSSNVSLPLVISNKVELPTNADKETLLKHDKATLVVMCKAKNCKYSGTKLELVSRILSEEEPSKAKAKPRSKTLVSDIKSSPVLKNIKENIPDIVLRYNKFNNLEHFDTNLIFSENDKIVIGKQGDDGTILPLKEQDINVCKQCKFDFVIPKDLDAGSSLTDVKIEGISDDEDEETNLPSKSDFKKINAGSSLTDVKIEGMSEDDLEEEDLEEELEDEEEEEEELEDEEEYEYE
jgi:hypothetical protein